MGGGGGEGLVTTYEVGVGVGYGLVYKTYPGTTPPPPPSFLYQNSWMCSRTCVMSEG